MHPIRNSTYLCEDLSYEAPNTPHTFVEEWKPEVQLNLETKSNRVQEKFA